MDVTTRVIDGVEYEVVFDGRQPLSHAERYGSTLGPHWIPAPPTQPPRRRGQRRKRERGWHQLTPAQVARAHRELQGE